METIKYLDNGIAVLENDSHISKWVEEHNSLIHNPSLFKIVKKVIHSSSNVIEVGACIGDNTEFLTQITKMPIHSFEPHKGSYKCLAHNMKNKNVVCRNIALSDHVHSYEVFEPNDNIGMASINSGVGESNTTTLDIYCQDNGVVPDFILCDAEGYELKILVGAFETLSKHKPILILEVNESALIAHGTSRIELFEYLDKIGYIYSDIYGEPLEKLHTQFDIICYAKSN